jgi:SAM-dependent methyltransferase
MTLSSSRIVDSRFWKPIWSAYATDPSIGLCRVPEIEYASTLDLQGRTLDHCCGDGKFAAIAWPGQTFAAGCDLNEWAIARARALGKHKRVDSCDAGQRLPYEDACFDLVFDNSALEHIFDLNAALSEIARVTKPGGFFAFNVLNHRYFEWWPMSNKDMIAYREWQPFFHALQLDEWADRLYRHGLEVEDVRGYFPEESSRTLALLDFEFSGSAIRKRPSDLVARYRSFFGSSHRRAWKRRIEELTWSAEPDQGAGYFIKARRQR